MLFVSGCDGKSYLAVISTGSIHRNYKSDPSKTIGAASYVQRENLIIVPQEKNCIFIFSPTMQQPLQRCFCTEKIAVTCVSPCEQFLIGGGAVTGSVFLWSLVTGELLSITKGHLRAITALSFSCDGSLFVSGSNDSSCKVWKTASCCSADAQPVANFNAHTLPVKACEFFASSFSVVTASMDRTCRVFDALTGTQMFVLGVEQPVLSIAVSPQDNGFTVGCEGGQLNFVKLGQSTQIVKREPFAGGHEGNIVFIGYVNGKGVLVCSADGVVLLWDDQNCKVLREVAHVKQGIHHGFVVNDLNPLKLENISHPHVLSLAKYPIDSREKGALLREIPMTAPDSVGEDGEKKQLELVAKKQVESTTGIELLELETGAATYNKKKRRRLELAISQENEKRLVEKRMKDQARKELEDQIASVLEEKSELLKLASRLKEMATVSPFCSCEEAAKKSCLARVLMNNMTPLFQVISGTTTCHHVVLLPPDDELCSTGNSIQHNDVRMHVLRYVGPGLIFSSLTGASVIVEDDNTFVVSYDHGAIVSSVIENGGTLNEKAVLNASLLFVQVANPLSPPAATIGLKRRFSRRTQRHLEMMPQWQRMFGERSGCGRVDSGIFRSFLEELAMARQDSLGGERYKAACDLAFMQIDTELTMFCSSYICIPGYEAFTVARVTQMIDTAVDEFLGEESELEWEDNAIELVCVAFHSIVTERVSSVLLPHWCSRHEIEDVAFYHACCSLSKRNVSLSELCSGSSELDLSRCNFYAPLGLMKLLDASKPQSVVSLLHIMDEVVSGIVTEAQPVFGDVTADVCIPLVVYIMISAQPANLPSLMQFVVSFTMDSLEMSSLGYAFATFEAASAQLLQEYTSRVKDF